MSGMVFNGRFQKPADAFVVQHFDAIDLNRIADNALLWILAAVGIGLGIHFLLSSLPSLFRGAGQAAKSEGGMGELQLKRRNPAQIIYHWVNAAAIVVLTGSGLAIYFGLPGTDGYFYWHLWAAWVLIAAMVFHIWYATILHKNFGRMWVTRRDLSEAMKRISGGSESEAPKHGFYKVEQIAFHWMLAAVVFGVVITGLMLWNPSRIYVAAFWMPWGWDAIFIARILHQIFTFALVALVLAHIYFAVLVPKEWPRLKSIFTGRVKFAWYAKEHKVSPRLEAQAKEAKAAFSARTQDGNQPQHSA